MHIVNSVKEQNIWVFRGAWNNISDKFPCLVLFSGVRDVYWCFWSLGIILNVQLCVILAPNTLYFGDTQEVQRSWFQSHQSQGSVADFTSNLTPNSTDAEREPQFYKGTQNNSLQHSRIWVLIMWQAGGELAVSWVVEWKRPACTDYITWFSFLMW